MMTKASREPSTFRDLLPAALSTDVRLCERGITVTVRGDLDVHSAPRLRTVLAEVVGQGEGRVVVLLDGVGFLDSTGLGVLVAAHKAQRARGGRLELVCDRPQVLRVLEVTGLDRVLRIRRDEDPRPAGEER